MRERPQLKDRPQLLATFEDMALSWQQIKSLAELMQAYSKSFEQVEGFPAIYWDGSGGKALLELDDKLYIASEGELKQLHHCLDCRSTVLSDEWRADLDCCQSCAEQGDSKLYTRWSGRVS